MLGPFEKLFHGEPEDWDQPTPPVFLFPGGDALAVWPELRAAAQLLGATPVLKEALAAPDWRGHAFACLAVALSPDPELFLDDLWSAVDRGSWVTPQLVALLCDIDATFEDQAGARLRAGCPCQAEPELGSIERHVFTGPAGSNLRSAKMAASLLTMLSPRLRELDDFEGARKVAEMDVDRSGAIAEKWLTQYRAGLEHHGWT